MIKWAWPPERTLAVPGAPSAGTHGIIIRRIINQWDNHGIDTDNGYET